MNVIIKVKKDGKRRVVTVNGMTMAYIYYCNNDNDVRVDDVAVYDSFIMPQADMNTAISFVITAYKSFYETFGLDIITRWNKEK